MIEFTARVTPTDGRPEPVRQLTFYLLRKSLADIRREAEQSDPAPSLDAFADGLTVSPELRSWMKKNHTVQLSGPGFVQSLTPEAITDVPEFFDAYMSRNSGFEGVGFPKPKFKDKDRTANPDKYKQQKEDYKAAIRKFIAATPESVNGMDADLDNINPYAKWAQLVNDHQRRLEKRALDLAATRYLAAQADTNLDGYGTFTGLAPGEYWVGTLGMQAVAGDVRLRWDVHAAVRPGEITRLELSNLNAADPLGAAPGTNR